jgi:hypothetical protein
MSRSIGGLLFYGAADLDFIQVSGTVALSEDANNTPYLAISASTVAKVYVSVSSLKRPFFSFNNPAGQNASPLSNELQEVFGTAAGGPSNPTTGGSAITPFAANSVPWGLAFYSASLIYSVSTAALTSGVANNALGAVRNSYVAATANAQTALVAPTVLTLTTTASATTPNIFTITNAQPFLYETTDQSDVLVKAIVTTASGGTARIYGISVHAIVRYA